MGLDMYAMVTTTLPDSPVDFKVAEATELHYWRKHPNLHGWMEALYFEKGGAQEFNCVPVELTADDLAFVAKAREAIAQGNTVYYDSWW